MTGIVATIGTMALPYAVKGVASWVGSAVKTYGPPLLAKGAIEAASAAGEKLMGGKEGVLGRIGSIGGRVFGWAAAPIVAQSANKEMQIGSEVLGAIAGAATLVGGNYLLNRNHSADKPKEDSTLIQQFLLAQQMQAKQLHAEWEARQQRRETQSMDPKVMAEFVKLIQSKKGVVDIRDLEEFIRSQQGKIDMGQLLNLIQMSQLLQAPQ